ncbi:hypothetical protein T11_18562 [Trichinella zimbabwensis]|uniref:Uncharacterized protein n=1 Tax=Trichinella zimbabwensis TaxID=268475 RepID=A0A0V1HPN3_9BILA|nr:hypothetical protein T11_18562 [Trichinella zimbabwensis]
MQSQVNRGDKSIARDFFRLTYRDRKNGEFWLTSKISSTITLFKRIKSDDLALCQVLTDYPKRGHLERLVYRFICILLRRLLSIAAVA